MRRNGYTVGASKNGYTISASAIDAYETKVLHDSSRLTRREIERRIISHVKGSPLDHDGRYPIHVRNGRQSSFYLVPETTNIRKIIDVLTAEEVKALS